MTKKLLLALSVCFVGSLLSAVLALRPGSNAVKVDYTSKTQNYYNMNNIYNQSAVEKDSTGSSAKTASAGGIGKVQIKSPSKQSSATRQNSTAKPARLQADSKAPVKNNAKTVSVKPQPAVQNKADVKTQKIMLLIRKDGTVSQKYYDTAVDELHKLPDKLIDYLKETNCKINISSYDLNQRIKCLYGKKINGELEGVFLRFDNVIFISQRYANDAPIHEIGHFVDYSYRFFTQSMKPEFQQAFNKEKTNLFSEKYYLNDIHEYFAESFRLYYDDPVMLRNKAPKTYDYLSLVLYKP